MASQTGLVVANARLYFELPASERKFRGLVETAGHGKVSAYRGALPDYTERVLRATIAEIPDGEYRCEDHLDDDGFDDRAR
jgi:N-methylhydantoinase B